MEDVIREKKAEVNNDDANRNEDSIISGINEDALFSPKA